MLTIKPGEHGSTYGGNPLGCKVAMESLAVLKDENLAENAAHMGEIFRRRIGELQNPLIAEIRGRGLLNAIVINQPEENAAWKLCLLLMHNGLLAKPTHGNIIRLAPPLMIDAAELETAVEIMEKSLREMMH